MSTVLLNPIFGWTADNILCYDYHVVLDCSPSCEFFFFKQKTAYEIVNAADREVECCTQHHIRDREQQHRGKKDRGGQATDVGGEITPAFHAPLQTMSNGTGEAEGQPPAACRLCAVSVPEIFRGLGVLLG